MGPLKRSARLLILFGVLFAIPIAAKTFAAHGAVAALATGILVVALVFAGPLAFTTSSFDTNLVVAGTAVTGTGAGVISILGLLIFVTWLMRVLRGPDASLPYLPIAAWALMGVYFCVSLIFTHIT